MSACISGYSNPFFHRPRYSGCVGGWIRGDIRSVCFGPSVVVVVVVDAVVAARRSVTPPG